MVLSQTVPKPCPQAIFPIDPEEWTGTAEDARLLTQRYTTALEAIIRRDPGQYLWLHRRWKHQPRARKAGKKTETMP